MADLNILRGAAFAAEAQRRGLSLEQAVDLVMAEMPGEVGDLREIPNREVQYGEFGNQDELQNFGGLNRDGRIKNVEQQLTEREKVKPASDPNQVSRVFFEKGKKGPQRESITLAPNQPMPERFKEAAKYRDFGLARKDVVAPAAQIMAAAKADLDMGINQFGADAFPGIADAAGRLEDNIKPNRAAEQALVRDAVRQDREGLASEEIQRRAEKQLRQEFQGNDTPGAAIRAMPIDARQVREAQIMEEMGRLRQNAEMVEANDWRANAAAQEIARRRFGINGEGAQADQALENIGLINKIGHAKIGNDFAVDNNPMPGGGTPEYLPVDLGQQYNAPATDNRFAGPMQKQQQFIVDNVPGYREGGAFGDYPQVAIGEQLDAARQALGQAKFKGQAVDLNGVQIRNLDELQAAADMVAGLAKDKGQSMFERADGKNVPIADPGIRAALERGGMNAREVGNVAAAMFQIEAARRNPLNETKKELFGAGLGQPSRPVDFGGNHPALGGGAAEIARLRGEKVEGKEVKAQLQALDGKAGGLNPGELKQARMPFIGAVAGEGAPRAQFVRGQDRGLSRQALIAKYGAVNGEVAARLNERAGQRTGNQPDGFGMEKTGFAAGLQPNEDQRGPRRIGDDIKNQLAELNSGAEQAPTRPLTDELRGELAALSGGGAVPPGGGRGSQRYMSTPDGPNNQAKGFAARAGRPLDGIRDRWSRAGRNQKTAAVVGGAVLGTLGLDALIGGESNRRKEEAQY